MPINPIASESTGAYSSHSPGVRCLSAVFDFDSLVIPNDSAVLEELEGADN
jgi:hypothetical protein